MSRNSCSNQDPRATVLLIFQLSLLHPQLITWIRFVRPWLKNEQDSGSRGLVLGTTAIDNVKLHHTELHVGGWGRHIVR